MRNLWSELKRRNVVRVAIAYAVVGWLVIQVGDIAADNLSFPDWFMPMIFVLVALGFPIALIISWAFELTPEGLKKTAEVDKSRSITPKTGQRINKLIIGGLALAVGFLLVDKFYLSGPEPGRIIPEAEAAQVSIAVLPFVNMSSDPEQEYFSDGITEEILNTLVRVEGLQVAARTSAFSYKGVNRDVREIGKELDVDTIVEGSVRRSGDDLRVTAQLIRVSDGIHLWSGTFDRKYDNVFAIQEEIAVAIAEAVSLPLGLSEGALVTNRVQNMEAYDKYLKARRLIRGRGQGMVEAVQILREVVAEEPGFAPAWAQLSVALITLPGYVSEFEGKPVITARLDSAAEMAAVRAVTLDPNLAEARHAYGNALRARNAWAKAEDQYKIALEIDPNSIEILEDVNEFYSGVLNLEKAMEVIDYAYQLEPDSPLVLAARGDSFARLGKFQEGLEMYLKALSIDPKFAWAGSGIIEMYLMNNQPEKLLDHLEANDGFWLKAIENEAQPPMDFKPLRAKVSGEDWTVPEDWRGGHWYPYYAYYIGGTDIYLDALEYWVIEEAGPPYYYAFDKIEGVLRSDRFKAVLLAGGLVDYWRESGWPKYCWPVGELDFECGEPRNE